MELFTVNRHEGDSGNNETVNEKANLDRLFKKVRQKNKAMIRNHPKIEHMIKTRQWREKKRQLKALKVVVPEGGASEFIDESIVETLKEVINEPDKIDESKVTEENKGNEEQKEKANEEKKEKGNKKRKLDLSKIEGFTVLGGEDFNKKAKVKRVLPKWLSTPTVISVDLQNLHTKVSSIKDLDKNLRKKLKGNGIKYFFPVQAEVIPWLIEKNKHSDIIFPRDVCVSAPTGSGKTLAFVLPVIQGLMPYRIKRIRALVILPTQDLAAQVFDTFKKYTQDTHVDVCLITAKNAFALEQKQLVVENEAFGCVNKTDILVCTAGRLVDHLKETKGLDLQHLKYLIIDEADRVLDNVQNDWLYHLEKHMHQNEPNAQPSKILNLFALKRQRPPQKLLFSATLSQDPEKLQKLSLFQPKLFTSVVESSNGTESLQMDTDTFIGKYTTPKELSEKYIQCSAHFKPLVLYEFIKRENLTKTMVFTNSIESAHRLAILLQSLFKDALKIEEVSSQLEAKRITELIDNFTKGNIDVIVCTDRLARGMDLIGVQCVISYVAPKYLKTYIHRAGRTARAGEQGLAVTLLEEANLNSFTKLLQQAGKKNLEEIKVPEEDLESLGEQYKEALQDLKSTVSKEVEENIRKIKSAKGCRKRKFKYIQQTVDK